MDIYGDGANEILLSKVQFLKKVVMKCFFVRNLALLCPNGEFKGTPEYVHQACENSLKRLYLIR
jgi:aryl-alcohol dehydrogenase-like predicted oxidoreductase